MSKSITLIFFTFLGLITTAQNITPSKKDSIDSLFLDFDRPNTPGCAVTVVQNGEIRYQESFGHANLEYDIPISSQTIFNVGSIAKQFTAFAVLLLEEKGKLSQDDDIRKYLPEIPDFGQVITLRHLIYHISGLREQFELSKIAGQGLDDVVSREQIIRLFSLQKELNFEPGDQFMYCNTGYTFLAEIVSRISGQSFPDFVKTNIFTPLKMNNTLLLEDHQKIIKNRAYSYFYDSDSTLKQRRLNYTSSGESNLYSNIEDLALWLINLENPKPGWNQAMERLYQTTNLNSEIALNYANGLVLEQYKGLDMIEHHGEIWGYKSYICHFPEQNLGIVILSNLSSFNPEEKAMNIADVILNNDFPDTAVENHQETLRTVKISTQKLEKFTGLYRVIEAEHTREIYLKDDQLMYKRGPGNESVLAPITINRFRMLGVDPKVDVYFEESKSNLNMLVEINDGNPIVSERYDPVEPTGKALLKYAGTYFCEELHTSYRIEVNNNALIAHHLRNVEVTLVPSKVPGQQNRFDSDAWWFSKVKFYDENGVILGFKLDTDRIRSLNFERVDV